jgi:hypothetical protein
MLAELDMLEGDAASAGRRARESLALYTDLEDSRSRARCLVVLACAAAAEESPEEAARALGAADALRGHDPPDDFERPLLDRMLPELAAALDEQAVADLRAEGARLGTDVLLPAVVAARSSE